MAMSEMSMAVHPVAPAKPHPGSVIYNENGRMQL
jgi:hypothetical protein